MNYPAAQYPGYPQQPAAPQFPGFPQAPQQGYPQQPQAPAYPQFPQQGYPAPAAAPQQPSQPLANGSLDDFFNQPGAGTGPSLSWKDKAIGTTYVGIVARDVTSGDVQQQTDPSTGAPKFFKDGRPQFVMKVPLKVQPSQEFPEGEATYFVRGQARDELVRAMAEAGVSGAPKAGAFIQVTLVQRRPSRMGNPANVVQIKYTPPQDGQQAPAPQPTPQVEQPQVQQQYAPQAQPAQTQVQQFPPQGQTVNLEQAVQGAQQYGQQQAPAPQPVQQLQQPAPQAPAAPQPPSDLSPEQQALLAQLTGGNAGQ